MAEIDPNAFTSGYSTGAALINGINAHQTALKAGDAYSRGDVQGASGILAKSGDLQGATAMDQYGAQKAAAAKAQADQVKKDGVTAMLNMAQGLRRITDPAQRQHAFQTVIAPLLKQQGIDDAHIQAMAQSPMDDQTLDATIAALGGELQKHEYQMANLGNGGVGAFDPTTGNVEVKREPDAAITYQRVKNADGTESIVALPKGGSQAAQTAQGGGLAQGGFDAVYDGFTAPQEGGYTPSDGNGAPANFGINQKANPDVGDVKNLTAEQARQIYKDRYWTPSGADKLPPALGAIQFDTAVNMGVTAAQHLLEESGGDPQKYLQLREARYKSIAAADPSKAKDLPTWLSRNAQLGQFIQGQGAAASPQGPQTVYTSNPKADAAGTIPGDPTKTGDDYLKTLPPADQPTVKALAEGRKAFPSGTALKDPYWQNMLAAAQQYDPTLDEVNFHTRVAIRKDFTSGASSKNITSFNTALYHLGNLDKHIDDLDNGPFPVFNWLGKEVLPAVGDQNKASALRVFEADKNAAASEMTRAFRGTGGAEADVTAWRKTLDAADSPQALHAAVAEGAKLLAGRINAMQETYTRGQSGWLNVNEFLSPSARTALQKFTGGGSTTPQQPAQAPQKTAAGATVSNW